MSHNLLDQFRGQSTPARASPVPSKAPYEAFRAGTARQQRIKLRPVGRAWERITYAPLYRLVEDGHFGTQLALVYSFAVIIIRGRNLHAMAEAIDRETCEFVQQFDPDRWERPLDEKAPFVEKIEFHLETRVEASDELLAAIASADRQRRQGAQMAAK